MNEDIRGRISMPYWEELTNLTFVEAREKTDVAVVVTGALEAHGQHLPLGTDNILPSFLAKSIAEQTNAIVLPAINFGDSWIFNQFEGTISIDSNLLVDFYANVMKNVFKQGFRYILVLNGHGGNSGHLESAAKRATNDGHRAVVIVNWWRDLAESARAIVLETPEGHAAEDETSEMLYVAPHLVDMDNANPAKVNTKFKVISGKLRRDLVPKALYGDPRKATREKGQLILEQAVEELIQLIDQLENGNLPIYPEKF